MKTNLKVTIGAFVLGLAALFLIVHPSDAIGEESDAGRLEQLRKIAALVDEGAEESKKQRQALEAEESALQEARRKLHAARRRKTEKERRDVQARIGKLRRDLETASERGEEEVVEELSRALASLQREQKERPRGEGREARRQERDRILGRAIETDELETRLAELRRRRDQAAERGQEGNVKEFEAAIEQIEDRLAASRRPDRRRERREGDERRERREESRGRADRLRRELEELGRRRDDLLRNGDEEAAREVEREVEEIEGHLRRSGDEDGEEHAREDREHTRDRHSRRDDREDEERRADRVHQLRQGLEELHARHREFAEQGHEAAVEKTVRAIHEIERALERVSADRHREEDREEDEAREHENRHRREGPSEGEIEKAARRVEHLRQAAENLIHAGHADLAHDLMREADGIEREVHEAEARFQREGNGRDQEHAEPLREVVHQIHALREEVQELRAELREIRELIGSLRRRD